MSNPVTMTWREFNKAIHGYNTMVSEEQIMNYDEIVDRAKICPEPYLSIIVLTYNHEKCLDECIKSLLCQKTIFSYEIILAEDCSNDKTLDICKMYQKKYPDRIRILAARTNDRGKSNAIRACRAARGRYISWCEGDDHWLTDDKVEKQISYLETHPKCGMVTSRYRVVDAQHKFQCEAPNKAFVAREHTLYRDGYVFCHLSTWCIRRSLYEKTEEIIYKIGSFSDTIMLTLAEGLSMNYIMPDIFSEYHMTGTGVWTSLSKDMQVMKSMRGIINRIRFFPEPMKTYERWNLFLNYYYLAKSSIKERQFIWFINSLLRSGIIFLFYPKIIRYYFISKRWAVKCV